MAKYSELINALSNKSVLYAEDEKGIRQNITEILALFFERVVAVDNGLALLEEMESGNYDVLVLDIAMPQMDGLEAVKEIRKSNREIPIIILSAYSDQEYLWRAVELKITKYLTKPHNKSMLIEALEQVALELSAKKVPFEFEENIVYFPCKRSIEKGAQSIHLSPNERKFLEYLIQRANCIVGFDEIYDHIWGYEAPSREAIKAIVKELRKKIGKAYIRSVYGEGYILEKK